MKQSSGGINRFLKNIMISAGLILALLLSVQEISHVGKKTDWNKVMEWAKEGAGLGISYIWKQQYPAASWDEEEKTSIQNTGNRSTLGSLLCDFFFSRSAIGRYAGTGEKKAMDYGEIDPAYAGYVESGRFYEEHSFLLYDGGEESGEDGSINAGIPKGQTVAGAGGNAGAGGAAETAGGSGTAENSGASPGTETAGAPVTSAGAGTIGAPGSSGISHTLNPQKDPALTCASSVIWPIIGTTYRKEQLADYDFMMKHFYSVHSSTTAGRDLMKADKFLSENFTLKGGSDKPQILIYHTHSQEEFVGYGPDNKEATVVGIGSYLTKLLTAKGYNVIHDTSVYDLQNGKLDRNKAYTYALDGVTAILQKNPSIEVVLDVHRDGVNESLHMVNQVDGKPTAPIMFFNGVSQTPEGPIEYLPNPYREQNLAFSFQLQLDCDAYFPNLTRKIYIKGLRYNQHLRPRSSLIEVGAQTNTYQEALNAMEPLAEVLDMVLQGN